MSSANTRQIDLYREAGDTALLFADALILIRAGKRGEPQRNALRKMLQLFKENNLAQFVALCGDGANGFASLNETEWWKGEMIPIKLRIAIQEAGYDSYDQLRSQTRMGLMRKFEDCGKKSVATLVAILERRGHKFSEEDKSCPIGMLSLSTRTQSTLMRAGVTTIEILISKTRDELLAIPVFGKKCLYEVNETLSLLGFTPR